MKLGRFTKSALRRSRTLGSGFDMTPAREHTICIRSTGKCRGQMLLRHSIRTWLPDIEPDSGLSMYIVVLVSVQTTANSSPDPQSSRNRKDRRRKAPLHQATPHKEAQISASSSRCEGYQQEDFCTPSTIHFCLTTSIVWEVLIECGVLMDLVRHL